MKKSLVIVESPAKARTLGKYLGEGFTIEATKGHIRDLPEKRFGVDIKNSFRPEYQVLSGREKVVEQLKKAAEKADAVYLASDPDREGEAIAWHMAELLDMKDKCFRATFNEVTRKAVRAAVENPGRINQSLVDAQQARRILDRLVGYKISPLLGRQFRWGLSAGRVQSVAVRLIVEREREVRAFVPEEFWNIEAEARATQPPPFTLKLASVEGKKAEVHDAATANAIVDAVRNKPFFVTAIDKRDVRRKAPAPFITSTLQQEAARKLRMTTSKTMSVAQKLYEGVEMGPEGSVGLITYMRTDSVHLSADAVKAARDYIVTTFGADFAPASAPQYKSGKSAQEAHEAIRPTDLSWTPERAKKFLSKEEMGLYQLIWNRFLASQMSPAVVEQTRIEASPDKGRHTFAATGQVMRFAGFLVLYEEGKDDEEENGDEKKKKEGAKDDETRLPPVEVGEKLTIKTVVPSQHFTKPPARFNEATLVRELERLGIGRPSTYASIISTIQNKKYVEKDKGRFLPTETGEMVTDVLVKGFPEIMDANFTAHMESELDDIEQGKLEWIAVLNEFYEKFSKRLSEAAEQMRSVKREIVATDVDCPLCGKKMNLRTGQYGRFLACSGYPECKSTMDVEFGPDGAIKPIPKARLAEPVTCSECGKPMVLKNGKRGPFLSCSTYPECRNTLNAVVGADGLLRAEERQPVVAGEGGAVGEKGDSATDSGAKKTASTAIPTDFKCDECGKPMVARRGRFGPFLSCSGYPKCKSIKKITRDMNISLPPPPPKKKAVVTEVKCEKCERPMVIRMGKRGPFLGCSGFPKCRNLQSLPDELRHLVPKEDAPGE